MEVGDVFSGTFAILKRRFGTFLGISAAATLLPTVLFMLGLVPFGMYMASLGRGRNPDPGPLAGMVLGGLALALMMMLIQLKSQAMLSQGAYETAQGYAPTIRSLLTSTRGFLPRMVPAVLGIGAIAIVVYIGFVAMVVGLVTTAASSGRNGGFTSGLVAFLLLMVFFFGLLWIGVKLIYWLNAATIEQRTGFDALSRSWDLIRGAFWRTFGFYLLATLLGWAITFPVSLLTNTLTSSMIRGGNWSMERDPVMGLLALGPVLLIVIGVQFVVTMLVVPFMSTYVTVMFLDQVRRKEDAFEPTGFGGGMGGQPWKGQAQQPWGQQTSQPSQTWGNQQSQQPQAWGQPTPQPPQPWNQQPGQPWAQQPPQSPQPWAPGPTNQWPTAGQGQPPTT